MFSDLHTCARASVFPYTYTQNKQIKMQKPKFRIILSYTGDIYIKFKASLGYIGSVSKRK